MKKKINVILTLLLTIVLVGCSQSNTPIDAKSFVLERENGEEQETSSSSLSIPFQNNADKLYQIRLDEDESLKQIQERKEKEREEEKNRVYNVNIMAIGDNLIHTVVMNSGKQSDGTYNYDDMYCIDEELEWADLKIINQETILVNDSSRYSSYPTFGSPIGIGESLINKGFNLITCATNHSFDKGESGILDTLNFWEQHKAEVTAIGMYKSQEDYDKIAVIKINNIKIACLNYTYGLNGFILPDDKQYLVKTLYDEDYIISEIQKAKEISDFVIVFPHWGTEYIYKPTEYQKYFAQLFADNGADLIIGTHPHVVEPLEYIESIDGRIVPCYYSLGNFVSGQDEMPRNLGGMAKIEIQMKDNEISIISSTLEPTVTHRDIDTKKIYGYMLEDYTEEMANKHWLNYQGKSLTIEKLWDLFNEITNNN